jgi:hypothetical protein
MRAGLVIALVDIAMKPGVSMSTRLITTRRTCRAFSKRLDSIREERRAMRREAGKLKAFLPFTRRAIADLEQRAQEHREDERSEVRNVLAGFGYSLLFDREWLAEALGFDRLCDLLNVNTVEREQARQEAISSLEDLVFIHVLEDSAERRGRDWGGAPLYNACHTSMANLIKKCPEHLLPDPFAPGEVFGPRLPPTLSIVGK